MHVTEYLAILGFTLSFFYNLPQIYKGYKTKTLKDVSIFSYYMVMFGQGCYFFRFLYLGEWPALMTCVMSVITCGIVVIQSYIYKSKTTTAGNSETFNK